ncbi:HNH endonuclease [Paracoccus sanguinis]|uniref:HNH endonuclease n=1 Tax=Paracoccus sanguinis TaxID=1545044 RepID=UPI00051FB8D4|nr:HNH endonuclease [Paracoccus sanguinis]KGJ13603.1 hypothetical protein IX54_11130 [Paracoccus sanguinis]
MTLTQARLKELLTYDPETGVFRRNIRSGRIAAGALAGSPDNRGYLTIRIDGKPYLAHRLAFLHMEGAFPPAQIDHINRDGRDNRWCNLRHATQSQNNANTKVRSDSRVGAKGVKRSLGKFMARIRYAGKEHYLGTFDTIVEASAAYQRAANDLHGEYARYAGTTDDQKEIAA